MTTISIVLPAYNEAKSIRETIMSIPKKELETMGYKVQILVVDNNSKDKTAIIARMCGAEVISELSQGYGKAIKAGFAGAKGEIIVTSDSDYTYPLKDIPRLVQVLQKGGYEYLNTNRFAHMEDGAMSFRNKVGNYILTGVCDVLFLLNMRDSQTGFCIFRKNILDKIKLEYANQVLCQELKIEACYYTKCKWIEVPIDYYRRIGKPKQSGWKGGFACLIHLFKKRFKR